MSGTFQSPRPESDSPYSRPDSSSGPSTNEQEHGDTQRSLQQASVALEVAYNRIRQVRRSLMELSESLPSTDGLPRFSMNFNEFEPGHEALLLAGDRFEAERELSRGFDASTTFTLPHIPPVVNLPNVERSTSTGDAQGVNEALLNRMDTDSILFQPLLSPNVLPPRFSRREHSNDMQYFQRPGITYDPASTLRGLRVAAREAQAREVQGLHAERRVLRETAIDSMLHTNGGSSRVERQNHLGRGTESLDSRRMAHSPPLPTAPPAWRAPDPRRWRIRPELRVNHRPSGVDVPDRFLTLSTMMNTPHSTDMSRNVPGLPLSTETTPTSAFERYHFYQEGMRLEDMASNINIDWSDDDFVSWLFPAQESNLLPPRERQQTDTQPNPEIIRITRTTDTAESPPESSPPRRGWARLDADGNEIPPNEEEELERSRTAYRLQALQRSRQTASGNNADNRLAGGMFQNYGGQRNAYGSVLDSTIRIQDAGRQHRRSPGGDLSPLYIDPLPMPLAAMTSTVEEHKDEDACCDIIVPKYACLAGR